MSPKKIGQIMLRVPPQLKDKIEQAAKASGESVNQFLTNIIDNMPDPPKPIEPVSAEMIMRVVSGIESRLTELEKKVYKTKS